MVGSSLVPRALGIAGAWVAHLTALEPMRPLFIGATLVFLGLAFRRLYIKMQVCEPGAVCGIPVVQKHQRLMFWMVSAAKRAKALAATSASSWSQFLSMRTAWRICFSANFTSLQ